MTYRSIGAVAASALAVALGAFAVAPLTAQAASGPVYSTGTSISADATNSVDVTGVPSSLPLGPFDPETGISNVAYGFTVLFNGAGYQVLFLSANSSGANFRLKNGTAFIPYTVTGASTSYAYMSGADASTPTLTTATPGFTINVPAVSLSTALPTGTYNDTLTVTVTAV
jgi:hypothetical protein